MNNISTSQFSAVNATISYSHTTLGNSANSVGEGEGFAAALAEVALVADVKQSMEDTENEGLLEGEVLLVELEEDLQDQLYNNVIITPQQLQQLQAETQLDLNLEQDLVLGELSADNIDPSFFIVNYSQDVDAGGIETSSIVEEVLDGLAPLMPKIDSEVTKDMEELASSILAYVDTGKVPAKHGKSNVPESNNIDIAIANNDKKLAVASKNQSAELLDELAIPAQSLADQAIGQNIPQALEALLNNSGISRELNNQVSALEQKLLSMNQHSQAPNYLRAAEGENSPQEQLVAKVQQLVNTGAKQVTMQLHPVELGEVTVQMDWDENETLSKVTFLVEKAESFNLLQQEAGKLAMALTDQRLLSDQASLRLVLQEDMQGNNSFAGNSNNNQNFTSSEGRSEHQAVLPINYSAVDTGTGHVQALASMLSDGYVDILV